ncbi:NAD(P)H-binding protein [Marinifilum sp. N1E240]|uniref:NAD(P)H-binding protein n=1 Tax=Marinifilum sp. N1E240 TaxID=2608082 RepID=UPI00128D0D03|nr:NAD(P)H-binding protein [Marinifilum sp. N1E240]MPQ47147.1 NAD(P)H-binding protein [Marinifilum sp. N1E240]
MNKTSFNRNKKISILGCGWLGLPLAEYFIQNQYTVSGSVAGIDRIKLLRKAGIIPYHIYLNPLINEDFDKEFFNSDILIVNFPPKRRDDIIEFHERQVLSLLNAIKNSAVKKVIFVSSTSVYANTNSVVDELNTDTPDKNSGKALRIVEELFQQEDSFDTTIVRFGGLIGYDRKPGRFFAGKKQVKDGESPVNLIHRDDCIGIINHIIENELWGEIFNACCPEHPKRKDFYKHAAKLGGFELPEFSLTKEQFKIISSEKLIKTSGYLFHFSNPIDAL